MRVKHTGCKIFYWLFWMAGLVYTIFNIYSNVIVYFKFTSNISQREDLDVHQGSGIQKPWLRLIGFLKYPLKEQVNFPNVLICADSLHSKKKVQDKYPSGSFISQQNFFVCDSRQNLFFSQIAESFEKSICLQSKNYMALISRRCPNHYGNIKRSCLHYTNLLEVSAKKEPIPTSSLPDVVTGSGHRKWPPEMWILSRIRWAEQN